MKLQKANFLVRPDQKICTQK
ncbi:BnaA03g60040D [Brassica napus]|uniref:BnaA03g60040D protein n=1 Tax=Brassica napus TaxID=3708 RepID=A0A078GNU5_BRANA|nr:BnaA03g60040D [Brassica napus]